MNNTNTNTENLDNTYNETLDNEHQHCKVDFLPFIDDSHLLKLLSIEIAKATQMPVHTVFLIGLGVFSSIACRKYKVDYLHRGNLPIGLYIVVEQPSGTGKTRVIKYFQDYFNKEQQKLVKENAKRIASLEASLEKSKESTPEESSELDKLKEKQTSSFFTTNSTPEALEQYLNKTNGFFSAVSSEQGLLNSLLGLSYNQAHAKNNNDVLLNGFDGGYIDSHRLTRSGYNGSVVGSVVLFAQSGSVESLLSQSNGTGLAERFILLAEPHTLGQRDHTKEHNIDNELLKRYETICNWLVKDILEHNKPYDSLNSLKLCEKGHHLIAEYRNKLEPDLLNGGKYSHSSLRGALGKINMQIMKIAANLHVLDNNDTTLFTYHKEESSGNEPKTETIALKHIEAAIKITFALLEANLGLLKDKGMLGQKAEYQAIVNYITKKGKASLIEIKNSMRFVTPFKNLEGNKANAISKTLQDMINDKVIVYIGTNYSLAKK